LRWSKRHDSRQSICRISLTVPLRRSTWNYREDAESVFKLSTFFNTRVITARKVNNEATAKAAVKLYSLYRISTCKGKVFVCPRMCPETTATAPNSPIALALH